MRKYKHKIVNEGGDFDDDVISLSEMDTVNLIREEYCFISDGDSFWAKEIDGIIYYSDSDVFETEKEDATHIVYFTK